MKREIAMYKCLECLYNQGTPWYITDDKSKTWKPKRCKVCGSKKLKFSYFIEV